MATASTQPAESPATDERAIGRRPDATTLDDKTPAWLRLPGSVTAFTLVLGFAFVVFANMRLWHTDLWDHVNYGRVILEAGQLPDTEPLLPLAEGMPMTNLAWLSQLGMAWLADGAGLPALQFVYGLLVVIPLALIAWRATQTSRSVLAGLLAAGFFVGVNLPQFLVIRPQLAGLLFFSVVLVWLTGRRPFRKAVWIGFPLMFALWVNCHGSFTLGLTLLGLAALGRLADITSRSGSLRPAIRDPDLLRMLLLIQLCAVAVLCNPWGLTAWTETFRVAGSPNVRSMIEWDALTLRTPQGQRVAAGTLFLLMALKMTPRRIRSFEVLVLVVFGGLALWSQRMINWWAPAAAMITAVHLAAWVRASHGIRKHRSAEAATGLWTVVNLGLCWILFTFTHLGIQVVRGRVPERAAMVSSETPVALVDWLRADDRRPSGLALVPAEWAGYAMHEMPADLQSMVNLHVHVIPVEVWGDYLHLLSGPSDTVALLDRYGVRTAVIDGRRHPRLLRRLLESEHWSLEYEDSVGTVLYHTHTAALATAAGQRDVQQR